MPALPAAIEVATYRIATEALTNIVRHSRATGALVQLDAPNDSRCRSPTTGLADGTWTPGVGLHAMRERAAELGGSFRQGRHRPAVGWWPHFRWVHPTTS